MLVNKVWAVYFSATGTTRKTVNKIADRIAGELSLPRDNFDFTLPSERNKPLSFTASDLVIFGIPVYAGRVPNVLLSYLNSIAGNNALAVAVTLYGNRHYDDALIELRDLLEKDGFHTIAAATFIGEHSFSRILAQNRPDEKDMEIAEKFALQVAEKVPTLSNVQDLIPISVAGVPYPYRGYYQPRDRQGNPVDIRKVRPLTGDDCNDCMICAELCPMGSISHENVREYTGICIKCGSCTKNCPLQARYFEDAAYIYHKVELEEGLTRRAEPELFL